MPKWLDKITGRSRPEITDAKRIYAALMTQSRRPEFYGEGRVPDNYDGRIDFLTLHMAIIMRRLRDFGDQGQRLSQALYDVMVEDFDVALREEALADTGVARRIKPIIRLFYTRVKSYTEALDTGAESILTVMKSGLLKDGDDHFAKHLSGYAVDFAGEIKDMPLGDIALANFQAPNLPK